MRIECERNEWILRYLEKGSEKSFSNFCKALELSGQGFLVNDLNKSVESKPVAGSKCVESVPVHCTEAEYTARENIASCAEVTTGSTQGLTLLSCCCLNFCSS